jgi:hypothetical protein
VEWGFLKFFWMTAPCRGKRKEDLGEKESKGPIEKTESKAGCIHVTITLETDLYDPLDG